MGEVDVPRVVEHIRERLAKSKMDSPAINLSRGAWDSILASLAGNTEARATAAEARVAELERDLEFVSKWAWREDPPHATSLLTAKERLDVIKYHPSIKAIWGFSQ